MNTQTGSGANTQTGSGANTQTGSGAQVVVTPWSVDERHALLALRMRYQQGGELFTTTELMRLQFVRWLYRTGQLVP